jgi:hypothetical protein
MYAVLGEDASDTESLKHIIRKLANNASLSIKTKDFDGCGDLLNRGHRILKLFSDNGCERFVICYDCNGHDPTERRQEAERRVIRASGIQTDHVIVVPVQELEAWIIADNAAVQAVVRSWQVTDITSPERIRDPKEYLKKMSRGPNMKPRYDPANHNPDIAKDLDLDKVAQKCPSFRPLVAFIKSKKAS